MPSKRCADRIDAATTEARVGGDSPRRIAHRLLERNIFLVAQTNETAQP
jgi:hypothetical protein